MKEIVFFYIQPSKGCFSLYFFILEMNKKKQSNSSLFGATTLFWSKQHHFELFK